MIPVTAARRRAERFHDAVEGAAGVTPHDAALLDVVGVLRAAERPEPRPDFVLALRERLMAEAVTALTPDTNPEAARIAAREVSALPRARRDRRTAAVIGGFAVVTASASMAVAAQSSLPGETLYPLKRAIENVETSVQGDRDAKGTHLLDNASGRLAEADELLRAGDTAVIDETMRDFYDQALEASQLLLDEYSATGRTDSIVKLRQFTAESMSMLERLQQLVPDDARDTLDDAASLLGDIDRQARALCPSCTDLPIVSVPLVTAAGTTGLEELIAGHADDRRQQQRRHDAPARPDRTAKPTPPPASGQDGVGEAAQDQDEPSVDPAPLQDTRPPSLPENDEPESTPTEPDDSGQDRPSALEDLLNHHQGVGGTPNGGAGPGRVIRDLVDGVLDEVDEVVDGDLTLP